MKQKIIIIGGGGHARVLIDLIESSTSFEIIGITDVDVSKHHADLLSYPIIGDDGQILKFPTDEVFLANGVGSTQSPKIRQAVFEKFDQLGYKFPSLCHRSAIISKHATISDGVQIMAGAIVQAGAVIGKNVILNTLSSVDHDCIIGGSVHLAPHAAISGNVRIGSGTHVGLAAAVIEGKSVGENCLVAAGAVVIRDVPAGKKVIGVPAKNHDYD